MRHGSGSRQAPSVNRSRCNTASKHLGLHLPPDTKGDASKGSARARPSHQRVGIVAFGGCLAPLHLPPGHSDYREWQHVIASLCRARQLARTEINGVAPASRVVIAWPAVLALVGVPALPAPADGAAPGACRWCRSHPTVEPTWAGSLGRRRSLPRCGPPRRGYRLSECQAVVRVSQSRHTQRSPTGDPVSRSGTPPGGPTLARSTQSPPSAE